MPKCELCNVRHNGTLSGIYKQIGGRMVWFEVCPKCKDAHDKYLEDLRQNFKTQFGDK